MDKLQTIDFQDTYSEAVPDTLTMPKVIEKLFRSPSPKIIRWLMFLRNNFVGLFGLKGTGATKLASMPIEEGAKLGILEIETLTDKKAIIGADDKHLNFRVLLNLDQGRLYCTTLVHFNNQWGRLYFFFVKPFHKRIVPALLKNLNS